MTKFFYAKEIVQPQDVVPYLAKQELHWRKNYSAYELATSWVRAGGIPPTVKFVLETCDDYRETELIEGFFEREVNLRTPGRRSQTDLLAFCQTMSGYSVIAVEGKVDESFGPLVSEWRDGSPNKEGRFISLCDCLGLDADLTISLRYQLFHRAASAIYEAQRYGCDRALMLVHSFSPAGASFSDFVDFTRAIGTPVDVPNQISEEKICSGIKLRFAWCADKFAD
jgi:hypothetical protein